MVSLRLEAISRFIGGLLLINIGIFVSLLVVTSEEEPSQVVLIRPILIL